MRRDLQGRGTFNSRILEQSDVRSTFPLWYGLSTERSGQDNPIEHCAWSRRVARRRVIRRNERTSVSAKNTSR